jgi:ParB family transcriptional regulator, chromosome partitioning protein
MDLPTIMENIQDIFTDKIKLPQNNMREHVDRDEIFELADDIKKNGLISPIVVRPVADGFELVAGQRRYLAHQVAGIIKIRCIIRELSDNEALAIMTSENLSRVDVNPVDEAKHVMRLMESNENDIKKVAHLVSRGEKWVADRLAIGNMPDYMQEFLAKKEIKIGVALILNQITDENIRRMWTLQAVRDGVNVAMAEYWLSDFKRQLLPGGSLAENNSETINVAPPTAIMFNCAIDGQQYDVRLCKSVLIYEGNLQFFNAFVSAFREAPSEN